MPLTSAEKMTTLRKRRAATGIFERTYFGNEKDHERMKKIQGARLKKIKAIKGKKNS